MAGDCRADEGWKVESRRVWSGLSGDALVECVEWLGMFCAEGPVQGGPRSLRESAWLKTAGPAAGCRPLCRLQAPHSKSPPHLAAPLPLPFVPLALAGWYTQSLVFLGRALGLMRIGMQGSSPEAHSTMSTLRFLESAGPVIYNI